MSRNLTPLVVVAVLAGCIEDAGNEQALPDADYEVFVEEVQPILAERCASSSCHGTERRPLELYAPSQHRIDPDSVHLDTPLAEKELDRNFTRSLGFLIDVSGAEDCRLLTKPLAMAAGGTFHVEVDVFETTDDPEYEVMRDWVTQALAGGNAG
jgi:hypothetical protein